LSKGGNLMKKTYKPGEKIPLEMVKEVEKFYWKTKDRQDITLEEMNALRFIEKQMQNDWKDYLLESETDEKAN